MTNEPVAWWDGNPKNAIGISKTKDCDDWLPLYTHPAEPKELTVPENSQDWKGMDGATAFWLIERHSNHWGDARLMMEEWLKANTHPAKTLTDEDVEHLVKRWFNCHPEAKLDEQLTIPLYSIVTLCKGLLKK